MTTWLEKLVKILALGFDTSIEAEQRSAFAVATDLAAKYRLSLARAYLRVERSMPESFEYLETKRTAAGVAVFVAEADAEAAAPWDASLEDYPGNRRALEAMLSCTVRPLPRRSRVR